MSVIYGLLTSISILIIWGFFMQKPKGMNKQSYNILTNALLIVCSVTVLILVSIAIHHVSVYMK